MPLFVLAADPETDTATGPHKTTAWKWGSTVNAVKRAQQFPDDFIAKGEEIVSVSWLEKSHANNHLASATHKRHGNPQSSGWMA